MTQKPNDVEVIVYTQPGCAPCDATKEFLSSHNINFIEKNIRQDPNAIQELISLGAMATPATKIGDKVITGFDPQRLAEALGIDA